MTAPAGKRPKDTLALRLIGLRHELGMSQREASIRTGVPFGTWQGMESGRSTRDLAKHIQAISTELGYDRDWLMWGDAAVNSRSSGSNGDVTALIPLVAA